MATFKEFIQSIQDDGNDGKVFEVFCKWFLKNDPYWKTQVDEVWLWDEWPERWQQKDLGIDLIFRHKNGELWSVQAKCYSETTPITKTHMDSFLSESGRFPSMIKQQLLFSATNKIEGNAKKILEIRESKVIKWLLNEFENSPINYPAHISELHTPQPKQEYDDRQYQIDAVNEVEEKFKIHDRGQLIMACGTGKTFVTLWIKERLKAQSTLVLLPSLSLLGQTMREWTMNCSEPFEVLCICSDSSVGKRGREEDISVAEAPFKVTSEVKEISEFLSKDKPKVLFCTYQSSELISQAQKGTRFDLIISDEAHRCVGSAETTFTRVLDKKAIKAEKRLFTTATPRVFAATVTKAAAERGDVMYGMDNIEAFGPEFYKYTFGQAIEDKWLSDYQVVIVGVNEPMVKDLIDEREILAINPNQSTDADTLASKIGLIKSIKDYNLKRVISFHSRVKSAKNFSSELFDMIDLVDEKSRPAGSIWTDYISGKMSAGVRATKIKKLKELGSYDRGLLTNSRCLSEGVDVPALDGVAFIDPRNSQVDIIQAVGRAIRLSAEKEKGTIILPVFIEENEDPGTAIDESNFKPIWGVLKALRSHDEILADKLDEYRTSMGREKGREKKTGITKIIFDLPQGIDSKFSVALETKLVEATTATWEFWYGLLESFKKREGHCRVKDAHFEEGFRLGRWVRVNRYSKNKLSKDRLNKLNSIGFIWDPFFENWIKAYNLYAEFKKKMSKEPKNKLRYKGFGISGWATKQRSLKIKGKLSQDKIDLLNEINFLWEGFNEAPYAHLKTVQSFYQKFKTFTVTNANNEDTSAKLAMQYLRNNYYDLPSEVKKSLKEIEFPLQAKAGWMDIYKAYKLLVNNNEVPLNGEKYEGFDLYRWHNRMVRGWDKLEKEKKNLLLEINFDPYKRIYNPLKKSTNISASINVPIVSPVKLDYDLELMFKKFISPNSKYSRFEKEIVQKLLIKRQKVLSEEQRDELMKIGVYVTKYHKKWRLNMEEYKKQIESNGDNEMDPDLVRWAGSQRVNKNLSNVRISILKSFGFDFDKENTTWKEKITFLKEYRKKYDNLDIPTDVLFNGISIRNWLLSTLSRKGKLKKELKSALIDLEVYNNWPIISHRNKPPAIENSLEYNYPELLKFWDYEKNLPLEPRDVSPGSNKIVWWKCFEENCNVSYDQILQSKVREGWGCPYCSGQRTRPADSLQTKFPDLSKCWDYEKNGDLKPIDVLPGSSRKVFWICERGHSFSKQIRHRAQRNQNKCPICKKLGHYRKKSIEKD